jgi:hypothetical protein
VKNRVQRLVSIGVSTRRSSSASAVMSCERARTNAV